MSIFFITVVVLAILVSATLLLFRRPFSPPQWLLYWVNQFYVKIIWRTELPERFPLPENSGAVIICNHRTSVDPCFIQAIAGKRVIHWMVAQLYNPNSLIGYLMKLYQVIPVKRTGADTGAAKNAIRMAKRGELVGMLPEGTINVGEDFMRPVRPGAILVALKARVPVLPCYLEGVPFHETLWRPALMTARVKLKVGQPIDLSEYYGRESEPGLIQKVTSQCVQEIAMLAGITDYEPVIAGRGWKTWHEDGDQTLNSEQTLNS